MRRLSILLALLLVSCADDPETVRAGAERVKSAVARLLERGLRERRGWFS